VWKISKYKESYNPTWDYVAADFWSVLEANVSVICVCMVSIPCPALLQKLKEAVACHSPSSMSMYADTYRGPRYYV
jgi:poly-beta-hydroxyalkanoate depolymerase